MADEVGGRRCAFCGSDKNLSKEHVLRAELGRKFAKQKWGGVKQEIYQSGMPPILRKYKSSPFDAVVKKVCKPCNNGWMNNLVEIPAEKILIDSMHGTRKSLTVEQVEAISLWAAKTAAVRALTDPQTGIPDYHYAYIKQNLKPPPGTHIWMADSTFNDNTLLRHTWLIVESQDVPSIHVSTISIGCMCLFVVGYDEFKVSYESVKNLVLFYNKQNMYKLWPEKRTFKFNDSVFTIDDIIHLSDGARLIWNGEGDYYSPPFEF